MGYWVFLFLSFFCFNTIAGERFVHMSGQVLEWPGKSVEGDYYPSFREGLFQKAKDTSGVSGDFRNDLYPLTRLGLFVDISSQAQREKLFKKYAVQLPKKGPLRDALEWTAGDRYIYRLLRQFFRDGGRIGASKSGGRYTAKPLRITVGEFKEISGEPEDNIGIETTLFHELLHYFFDKSDCILSEVGDGSDHRAIDSLEERYVAARMLLSGEFPFHPRMCSLAGYTTEGKLGDEILLRSENATNLLTLVRSETFIERFVHATMVTPIFTAQSNRQSGRFALSDDQLQDIAFMSAFTANILRQALIKSVATKGLNSPEFQVSFRRFLRRFTLAMEQGRKSVSQAAFESME